MAAIAPGGLFIIGITDHRLAVAESELARVNADLYAAEYRIHAPAGSAQLQSLPADDSIGGWRPLGFVSLALKKGYRLGFQAPAITLPRTCLIAICG